MLLLNSNVGLKLLVVPVIWDLTCSFLVLYSYLCQQHWPGLCRNGHGIAAPYKIYWVLPKAGFLPQSSSCPSIQVDVFSILC